MKIKSTLFTLLALFAFLVTFEASAFVNPGNHLPFTTLTADWQLDREIDGIQIYARRVECNDVMNGIYKEYVMLKFVNTTAQDLRLEWGMEFWFDGNCTTCGNTDNEYHYILDLDAGESLEGRCDQQSPREVKLFLRFLNYEHIAKLTQYNMANLKVNPR